MILYKKKVHVYLSTALKKNTLSQNPGSAPAYEQTVKCFLSIWIIFSQDDLQNVTLLNQILIQHKCSARCSFKSTL